MTPDATPEQKNEDFKRLFRRLVIEDLVFHPVSSQKFQWLVKNAASFFYGLINGSIHIDPGSLPYFQSELEKAKVDELLEKHVQRHRSILQASHTIGIAVPDEMLQLNEVKNVDWRPTLDPEPISNDAFEEQNSIFHLCIQALERKKSGEPFTLFPVITG